MPHSLKHGVIQADIIKTKGRSVISSLKERMPLRASNCLYPDESGAAFFYILNPAAGLLAGDRHDIFVRVKNKAHAVIFGQGATKVFRAPEYNSSRQFTTINVEDDARLEYMPEVIIPYAEASFVGRTNLFLTKRASAFLWEITAPGRVARGEEYQYSLFDQCTNIYLERELIYSDRFVMEPKSIPARLKTWRNRLGLLHGFSHTGTFWAIHPKLNQTSMRLLCRNTEETTCFMEELAAKHGILLAGTALLPQAYCFRALGNSTEDIQEAFKKLWGILREEICQESEWPWRKY